MKLTLDDLYLIEIALYFLGERVDTDGLLDRVKAEINDRKERIVK